MSTDDLDAAFARAKPMHSHDRTMLAKLGFADPDKGDVRHELACQYLRQKEVSHLLMSRFTKCFAPTGIIKEYSYVGSSEWKEKGTWNLVSAEVAQVRVEAEVHLQKGTGQYATTVGFMDLTYSADFLRKGERKYNDGNVESECHTYTHSMIIEVKIGKVMIGDILRQLKLYLAYYHQKSIIPTLPFAMIVAPWDITEQDWEVLKSENMDFVRLGSKFDEWVKTRTAKTNVFEI